MSAQIEPLLTVDDLDLLPEDGNRYEVIEGEIFVSRAPGLTHQIVITNLIRIVGMYLDRNPIGIIVPGPGVIFSKYSGVIPDLVFISRERRAEVASGEKITGAPDLVIEIVSPGLENSQRDRVVKRQLYGKYGVKEYWVIDPAGRSVEVYRLRRRALRLAHTFTEQDDLTSSVLPEFTCKVSAIFLMA